MKPNSVERRKENDLDIRGTLKIIGRLVHWPVLDSQLSSLGVAFCIILSD